MILYHVADPSSVPDILEKGIKRTSRGEKGDDTEIIRTDRFLDGLRSSAIVAAGISRDNNLYAYLSDGNKVVDIESGRAVDVADFVDQADGAVLKVKVDMARCYVSDLDSYDEVKRLVESEDEGAQAGARLYWSRLVRLDKYKPGQIRRPEVMIPYDIPPECIEEVK